MKIICVGRNYVAHAAELGNSAPTEPIIFIKPKTALLSPGRDFYYPEFTDDLHYEAELVYRICKNGKHIQEKFAHTYYDEITIGIDFTARDIQERLKEQGLPWELAKGFDGSAVVGEFIPISQVTPVQQIPFSLDRNGERVQEGHSGQMLFNIDKVIAFASQYFSLNIGDLIYTGTPPGVGATSVEDHFVGRIGDRPLLDLRVR